MGKGVTLTHDEAEKLILGCIIGMVAMVIVSLMDYSFILRFTWLYYIGIIVLLGLVMTGIGDSAGGAQRWIDFGGFRFQPSELAKIVLILFFARFFSKHAENLNTVKTIGLSFVLIGIPLLLIVKQPDTSTSIAIIVQKIRQQSGQLFDASETLNNNAVKTAGNVNNVETAVNEIATSATSQAQETQGATESIISMGTMIEDSTSQVKSMNETADVMNESGQIAKKALEELGEINERATESINVIYEQTNTTNDSALKIN